MGSKKYRKKPKHTQKNKLQNYGAVGSTREAEVSAEATTGASTIKSIKSSVVATDDRTPENQFGHLDIHGAFSNFTTLTRNVDQVWRRLPTPLRCGITFPFRFCRFVWSIFRCCTGNHNEYNRDYMPTIVQDIDENEAHKIDSDDKEDASGSETLNHIENVYENSESKGESGDLGHLTKPVLPEKAVSPVGTRKGIEGAHNSCYLDSYLFSTFYSNNIFDFLLTPKPDDSEYMKQTRAILRDNVVNPLRKTYFCSYEQVWELREHLSSINEDLKGSFMDAEQVLYILCKTALKESHFVRYDMNDSDWGDYMFLMTPDLDDVTKIGMPRSNRILIHYKAVIPNPKICIEKYLHPAKCGIMDCGKESEWEIQTKRGSTDPPSTFFICGGCLPAWTSANTEIQEGRQIVSRKEMKLNAIMCIRGCHFVAFVLANKKQVSKGWDESDTWYFFDSMAGGYPEVRVVPKMNKWLVELADDPNKIDTEKIPPLVRRSLTDGHICIYAPVLYEP